MSVKPPLGRAKGIAKPSPDVPNLGPVLQEPAVGRLVLPAGVAGVFPEQLHLVRGVPRVPQGIAQILARAGFRLHCLTRRTDVSNVRRKDWPSAAAGPQQHRNEKGKNPLPKFLFSVVFFFYLQLNSRFCHCPEGVRLPVRLFHLLPHHHVETGTVLVAEDETGVIVICGRVDVERALKVHSVERRVTWNRQENK